jgi:hypothetical protein
LDIQLTMTLKTWKQSRGHFLENVSGLVFFSFTSSWLLQFGLDQNNDPVFSKT